ncbi:MAG: MFS transporter [Pyrinomonadaceae bacterium]|nr:MFS transporter [Pyrinomonadaceae bacterium]
MKFYATSTSVGVWETFLTMGAIYFVFMMFGVFTVRVPAADWKPEGYTPPVKNSNAMITTASVTTDEAIRTPQFYFLWVVLFLNVTAGIGILAQASPLIQETFLLKGISAPTADQTKNAAAAAAGFVGLLSFFNLIGRFFWSSLSDKIGRKPTYI